MRTKTQDSIFVKENLETQHFGTNQCGLFMGCCLFVRKKSLGKLKKNYFANYHIFLGFAIFYFLIWESVSHPYPMEKNLPEEPVEVGLSICEWHTIWSAQKFCDIPLYTSWLMILYPEKNGFNKK